MIGLSAAVEIPSAPSFVKKQKLSSMQKRGIAWQNKVGKFLRLLWPQVKSGQWFQYYDRRGSHYAQADHFVIFASHILLVECKLTQNSYAFTQMAATYRPLLRKIYSRPVVGVQCCRNIRHIPEGRLVEDIKALESFPGELMLTWHGWGMV